VNNARWRSTYSTHPGSDIRALAIAIGPSLLLPTFAVAASGDSRVSGRAPGRFCRLRILHDLFSSSCSVFSTVLRPRTFLHPTHTAQAHQAQVWRSFGLTVRWGGGVISGSPRGEWKTWRLSRTSQRPVVNSHLSFLPDNDLWKSTNQRIPGAYHGS